MFNEDMLFSFPELRLYLSGEDLGPRSSTSGRSSTDEYKRTMGALFAVYWLMRLDLGGEESASSKRSTDGQRGFCFGVDEYWEPPIPQQVERLKGAEGLPAGWAVEKRLSFLKSTNWQNLFKLVVDAGMLKETHENDGTKSVAVDVERTVAMLTLTAIHDLMKCGDLLPSVQKHDAPYKGVAE
eukprot:1905816-Prymnesium_polylepis.1